MTTGIRFFDINASFSSGLGFCSGLFSRMLSEVIIFGGIGGTSGV